MFVALIGLMPIKAPSQTSSAAAWRDLTLADVEAAHSIIARNHPAAVVAAGDSAFRERLESARVAARGRARDVSSYEGWLATLRAFAVAFDDPHISLGTRLSLGTVRWPGFVVARRGDSTLVASQLSLSDGLALRSGATLKERWANAEGTEPVHRRAGCGKLLSPCRARLA